MTTAKGYKFHKDRIYTSKAELTEALAETLEHARAFNNDAWELVRDNLPTITMTDEEGHEESVSILGPDDNNTPALYDHPAKNWYAIVTPWSNRTIPNPHQANGEPWVIPHGIYVLAIPRAQDMASDTQLADTFADMMQSKLIGVARKIATSHAAEQGKMPLDRDPASAVLTATTRRSAGGPEAAFKAVGPKLRDALILFIGQRVKALSDAGQKAKAERMAAAYSKERFNLHTFKECLQSKEAAERHFPGMPQATWVGLLDQAIAYAPQHQKSEIVKDASGQSIKQIDPETGQRRVVREAKPAPQSPAIFQRWKETRDETVLGEASLDADFSDLKALMT